MKKIILWILFLVLLVGSVSAWSTGSTRIDKPCSEVEAWVDTCAKDHFSLCLEDTKFCVFGERYEAEITGFSCPEHAYYNPNTKLCNVAGDDLNRCYVDWRSTAKCGYVKPELECEYQTDCDHDQKCAGGQCTDLNCAEGYEVSETGHLCIPIRVYEDADVGEKCGISRECKSGLHCVVFSGDVGTCQTGDYKSICADDDDCDFGLSCKYYPSHIDDQGFAQGITLSCVYPLQGEDDENAYKWANLKKRCEDQGNVWNDQTHLCDYDPKNCDQAGGTWDAEKKLCIMPEPDKSKLYAKCMSDCADRWAVETPAWQVGIPIIGGVIKGVITEQQKKCNTECLNQYGGDPESFGYKWNEFKQGVTYQWNKLKSKSSLYIGLIVIGGILLLIFAPSVLWLVVGILKSLLKKLYRMLA